MRHWWVNQNKTYRHEFEGGYLWSPKVKRNGAMNPYYEFMREVSPGDLVFSFAGTLIRAVGVARSYAYEAPKPEEFGSAGRDWNDIGWRVDVSFQELPTRFRPADWIELLRPLLPDKYAPLLPDGRGSQSVYLTAVPEPLALKLAELVGPDVLALARTEIVRDERTTAAGTDAVLWEEHLLDELKNDPALPDTDRQAIVTARRGQGKFRERVQRIESFCRVTRVDREEHLRASHCKPWRDATNEERLDGENGLLLTPSIDHLFDRGFISFERDGRLLVSPVAHAPSLERMGVPTDKRLDVGAFTDGQGRFLEYHRDSVFLRSRASSVA
jgi:hypothetical protein